MNIETTQVKLRVVNEKDELPDDVTGREVLNEIKKHKNLWRNDEHGKYISIMYDAHEFRFRPGKALTVGKLVANALRRSSAISIGPDYLNGPMAPMLIVEKEFVLGDEDANEDSKPKTMTTCPVCNVEQNTLPKLTRHIEKHKADHPELFNEPDGIQWEGKNELTEADGAEEAGA
jgi:hypothetical protein